jgi:O-antigen/teichoic acid export membrane protein
MGSVSSFGRKEVYFTLGRYVVYALQISKGFALAFLLGPFFFGVYGYIMLYQQYLVYSNLGIQYALNAELSINGDINLIKDKITNSAFSLTAFIALGLFILSLGIYYFKIDIFPYKDSYKYTFVLLLLACLGHFQEIFINVFRINKNLLPIIFSDLFVAAATFFVIPFFKGINLINAVLWSWILSLAVSMIIYKTLYKKKVSFEGQYIKTLINSGIPLILFVFSYNLMGLLIRTLISIFYDTATMGYFSFTNSLTSAIMLSFNSITWLMYPSLIAKLGDIELKGSELQKYLIEFSKKLVLIVFIIICVAIIAMPLLFIFLPKYLPVKGALSILLLNQVVFNAGFAYVSLAIGRKIHYQIAYISFISVGFCFLFGLLFSYYHLSIVWLAIANLIGSLVFLNIFIYFVATKFGLSYKLLLTSFDPLIQVVIFLSCIAAIFNMLYLIICLIVIIIAIKHKDYYELILQIRKNLKK